MNKTEKRKLAEIILDMQHGSGATYETASRADDLITTFPSVKEFIRELEEDVYVEKFAIFVKRFLYKTVNPVMVSSEKYASANNLAYRCSDYLQPLISDYCLDKEITAESLCDNLEMVSDYLVNTEINSLLKDEIWCGLVDEITDDSLERRFLKGELEEYSFLEEMQGD